MYNEFYLKNKYPDNSIPYNQLEINFKKLKEWQKNNYLGESNLSIEKIAKLAYDYFGLNYKLLKNFTVDEIKNEIANNRPVIIPAATGSLNNIRYGKSNLYHILLIIGYNSKGAVIHDCGVSNGKAICYKWEYIFNSIKEQNKFINQGNVGLVLY